MIAVIALAPAQTTEVANRLIDRIVANEQDFLNRMKRLHPVLETYIQEKSENGDPETDHYIVGRLDLRNGVDHIPFASSPFVMCEQAPRISGLTFIALAITCSTVVRAVD